MSTVETKRVGETLTNRGIPMTVTVQLDDEPVTVNVAEELERMNDKLEANFNSKRNLIGFW